MNKFEGTLQPNILPNCELWLDAFGPIEANFLLVGGFVSQWFDKSGNNRHATQSSSVPRPLYMEDGFVGKPTLNFDGVSDYMKCGSNSDWTFIHDGSGGQAYIVCRIMDSSPESIQTLLATYGWQSGTVGFHFSYEDRSIWENRARIQIARGVTGQPSIDINGPDNSFPSISNLMMTFGYKNNFIGNDYEAYRIENLIQNQETQYPPSISNSLTELYIGSAAYGSSGNAKVRISEIVLFSEKHDVATREQLTRYFENKWGI